MATEWLSTVAKIREKCFETIVSRQGYFELCNLLYLCVFLKYKQKFFVWLIDLFIWNFVFIQESFKADWEQFRYFFWLLNYCLIVRLMKNPLSALNWRRILICCLFVLICIEVGKTRLFWKGRRLQQRRNIQQLKMKRKKHLKWEQWSRERRRISE